MALSLYGPVQRLRTPFPIYSSYFSYAWEMFTLNKRTQDKNATQSHMKWDTWQLYL